MKMIVRVFLIVDTWTVSSETSGSSPSLHVACALLCGFFIEQNTMIQKETNLYLTWFQIAVREVTNSEIDLLVIPRLWMFTLCNHY